MSRICPIRLRLSSPRARHVNSLRTLLLSKGGHAVRVKKLEKKVGPDSITIELLFSVRGPSVTNNYAVFLTFFLPLLESIIQTKKKSVRHKANYDRGKNY